MPLIPNNGWETGDAGGWTLGSTGSAGAAGVSSLGPRTGTYHLRLGSGSASGGTAFARYEIPTFLTLAGLKVIFRVYSNRVDGVPSTRRIRIDDGVGVTDTTLGVVTSYNQFEVSRTIDASPTKVLVEIYFVHNRPRKTH